jgi:UrcA family protein
LQALHDLNTECGRNKRAHHESFNHFRPARLIATAIFGFVGLGLCVVAAADPSAESRTVKFANLDISNPSDAHVLYRRIRAAAQVVCSYYFFATDTDKARCVRDASTVAPVASGWSISPGGTLTH